MFLIDNILLAPLKSVIWVARKIDEVVEKELFDKGQIKERLMELQLQLELGEISEEEFNRQEEELLARLDAIIKTTEKD